MSTSPLPLLLGALGALSAPSLSSTTSTDTAPAKIRCLILDGVNNHNWQATTKATKATLLAAGRFTVDVSTSPAKDAGPEAWAQWKPDFAKYQVVVSNFNDGGRCLWSEATKSAFVSFVKAGGGFLPVHAADNASADWPEYNEMIAVGGWGGRKPATHGSLLRKSEKGWGADPAPTGGSGGHGPRWAFPVRAEVPDHPILKGLPKLWMHGNDELYNTLRGPCRNVTVLASSPSKATGTDEPMAMLIRYEKGQVFHLPMGHVGGPKDVQAVHCVGFQTLLARGAEFVATGKVTLPIPADFPTAEAVSIVPPTEVKWEP